MTQEAESEDSAVLSAKGISVCFGGLMALARLSFSVNSREILSVIGPNGAGKTTLLNAVTGVYPLYAGDIFFRKKRISGMKPFQIAAMGISRTFQHAQLFMNMTVRENVMVGMHSRTASGFVAGMLRPVSERREEALIRKKSDALLDDFGLHSKAGFMAENICMLDQRRLEMARAMAAAPEILLLDEPAAGLTMQEITELGDVILKLRERGQTIILVEHHMRLVMGISDTVIVLHHGSKIGEGAPKEIQKNPQVIDAYLGGYRVSEDSFLKAAGRR